MEIKGVTNSTYFVNSSKARKSETAANAVQKDKIEISDEARGLVGGSELSPERVSEIREKISSGFYNTDEVLNKVADKLRVDLKV